MTPGCARYSIKFARRYCALIAAGSSRRSLHARPGMPPAASVARWLNTHPEFKRLYEAACARRGAAAARAGVRDPARPGGVTIYAPELAARIGELVSEGLSLLQISAMDGMPCAASIHGWKREHPEFEQLYRDAWETRAQDIAEGNIRIADEALGEGWARIPGGEALVSAREALTHAKLMIHARTERVLKLAPRREVLEAAAERKAERPKTEAEMTYAERLALLD